MTETPVTRASEKFDATSLTLGEIAFIEDYSGLPLAELSNESAPKGRLLAGMAYVIMKRDNPKFTIAAAEKLTLKEATALIGTDEENAANPKVN